jgi:hypothetical protein
LIWLLKPLTPFKISKQNKQNKQKKIKSIWKKCQSKKNWLNLVVNNKLLRSDVLEDKKWKNLFFCWYRFRYWPYRIARKHFRSISTKMFSEWTVNPFDTFRVPFTTLGKI